MATHLVSGQCGRLRGIEAPEAVQRCGRPTGDMRCCGGRATARLPELVEGQEIECEARDRNPYGRIIAACHADGTDLNAALVSEGGLELVYTRFSDGYAATEASTRTAGIGVSQGQTEALRDYRANRSERAVVEAPDGCPIKSNINSRGERIYPTPCSPSDDRAIIDESNGQRWFCTEEEAETAGWRLAGCR